MRIHLALLLSLVLFTPTARAEEPSQARPDLDRLRAHVEWLCDAKRMGRGAWANRRATAGHIAVAFTKAGLKPLPGRTSLFLSHKARAPYGHGRNVAAWLPGKLAGTTAAEPGDYVIVSAHFDHLGAVQATTTQPDGTVQTSLRVYPGADDNASGTAALLELARLMVLDAQTVQLDRSVMFVAYDLEERGLIGSRAFVKQPPLPLASCKAFVTMDQLGRSLADVTPGALFYMGTENCAALNDVISKIPAPKGGYLMPLGIDFQPGYSDYVPFKERKMPYVFVTSGACADYHQPTDTPSRIEWPHLAARTGFCRDLMGELAAAKRVFKWSDTPSYHPDEMKTLRKTIREVEENATRLRLPKMAIGMLQAFGKTLDKTLEDGVVTKQERDGARITALMLFNMAAQIPR